MTREFSIAEARDRLAKLVHDAEERTPVVLTRRGKPVAVILSIEDYEGLVAEKGAFWDRLVRFRKRHQLRRKGLSGDELANLRDPDPGREVDL
jgi:prevent-host-death family protein